MKTIYITNESSVCTDAEIQGYISDLQTQVTRDFAPLWATDAQLQFVSKANMATLPQDAWVLHVLDTSDQAGALGYHEVNKGYPIGFVFAKSDKDNNNSVSVTISHELLELLADPLIFSTVLYQARSGFRTVAYLLALEVADAPEADQFGYKIGNTLVSDFVTPAWFGAPLPAGGKYDFMGHITAPFQILQGGYIGAASLRGVGQWTQITGRAAEHRAWECHQMVNGELVKIEPPKGSRRDRRNTVVQEVHGGITAFGVIKNDLGELLGKAEGSLHTLDNATNWVSTVLSGLAQGKTKIRTAIELNPPGFSTWLENR